MTDAAPTPEAEIAGTLNELSEQTRHLVRAEVAAAQQEMLDKARSSAPVVALAGAAAALAMLAGASAYRFGMRLLERVLPPSLAALLAAAGYGAGALAAAKAARDRLGDLRPPVPSQAVRTTVQSMERAASS